MNIMFFNVPVQQSKKQSHTKQNKLMICCNLFIKNWLCMFVQGEYLRLLRACVSKRVCLLKCMRLCVKKYTSSSIPEMNVTFCHAPVQPDAKTESYQAEQNNDLLQPVHIKRTPCFFASVRGSAFCTCRCFTTSSFSVIQNLKLTCYTCLCSIFQTKLIPSRTNRWCVATCAH